MILLVSRVILKLKKGKNIYEKKFDAECCRIRISDAEIWLVKPQSYMNLSGGPVRGVMDYYQLETPQLLVAHDEIDLPPGTVKLKKGAPKPKVKWTRLSKGTKSSLLDDIKDTPMSFGTDWANPFELAFKLVPKPDVIYFMTDGAPQAKNEEQVLKMVKDWNKNIY